MIESRSIAVHYWGGFEPPVAHSSGTNASAANARYCYDEAAQAVRAMRSIYLAVADHPKLAVAQFAGNHATHLRAN